MAAIQTQVQELEQYYYSAQKFLIDNGLPSLLEAESRVRNAEEELQAVLEKQRSTQLSIQQASSVQSEQPGRIDSLRQELLELKSGTSRIEQTLTGLIQEEERLTELLASLEVDRKKTQRLRSSTIILSSVEFAVCPRCLLEVTPEMRLREQSARCMLCNRPIRTTSDTPPRSIPRTEDLDAQIEETREIVKDVQRERGLYSRLLQENRVRESRLGVALDMETRLYIAPAVDQLLALSHDVAKRERLN